MKCIISCEHASNRVPQRFANAFKGKEKVVSTHQAYDPGAAGLARRLAKQLHAPVYLGSISRLLIDLNRSTSNRKTLYTPYSRKMAQEDRELLLKKYYHPYREKVEGAVGATIARGKPVLHISVHSFVPVKHDKVRKADIGLLYDPARRIEKDISGFLAGMLKNKVESLRVRKNYPYLGRNDGFTSYLRKNYSAKLYAGIEIEINQAFFTADKYKEKITEDVLIEGIRYILKLQNFSQFMNII